MTTSQIMMKLREIETNLNLVRATVRTVHYLSHAQTDLSELIEEMLADERRAREAHTMGELPFDGQRGEE